MRRQYDFEIKDVKVFATCNEINRLSKPLRSRFRRLHLPQYSREQFPQIAVKVCPKLSEETWEQQGDIRDVISLSKLVNKHDDPGEIAEIIKTLAKYGEPRLVRGSGDRSGGYGFPAELNVCDPRT